MLFKEQPQRGGLVSAGRNGERPQRRRAKQSRTGWVSTYRPPRVSSGLTLAQLNCWSCPTGSFGFIFAPSHALQVYSTAKRCPARKPCAPSRARSRATRNAPSPAPPPATSPASSPAQTPAWLYSHLPWSWPSRDPSSPPTRRKRSWAPRSQPSWLAR